ncbi:penicillin-binding protein activator [Gammaproteobacteria bacterium AB-CW1]|uniref:Penicillin-binding protein activator n=1 Tax=Natronospira elongata TaxID=3110268 RepID=A0AAP6MM49_9GAMM|nr:penicillin-binding protein activator [Gammaproteobacteria bacterium AB-CW1]
MMTSAQHKPSPPQTAAILRPAGLLLAALLLWSCAPTPVEREPLPETEIELMADSAELMRDTGDPEAAASIYQEIAASVPDAERPKWLFQAMEAWIEAGETDRARGIGGSLVPAELPREERFRLAVTLARADLMDNRPQEALARIDVREEGIPRAVAPELLAVRGEARFRLEDAVAGIADLQRRADLLGGDDRLAALQTIWDRLMALPSLPDREQAAGRPLISGWLNLARAGQQSWQRPDQFDRAVAEWEALHRDHPASELMDQLLADHRERFRYPDRVALLLPLSGRFAAPAEAVRDGFLAAHFNQPGTRRPAVRVYDTGDETEGVLEVYQQAVADGAGIVIGPLTRPALSELRRAEDRPVTVLGLNYLDEEEGGVDGLVQFGLRPESEARQVAQRMVREGHRHNIALIPETEWGYRMLDAYREALADMDAELLDFESYLPQQRDFSDRITRLMGLNRSHDRRRELAGVVQESLEFEPRRRQDIDGIFLASQDGQASLIKPQLRFHRAIGIPVFASSHVYRPGQSADTDLDGIRFADMPWSIAQEGEARDERERISGLWPELFDQHGRLFALGFDAYRLVPVLSNFEDPLRPPLAAMTGVLSLDEHNRVQRELGWAMFSRGQPIPLEPIEEQPQIPEPAPLDLEAP